MINNILPPSAVPFPNIYSVEVTPELATQWISDQKFSRPENENLVQIYAAQMLEGNWPFTHQGIAFDKNGQLLDGRHRLLAVIRSGKTVSMLVILDEPSENISVIDNRNLG